MKVSITRQEHFNAAHRLSNPAWSDEKNQSVFGKCYSPNYHGHNYLLEVTVTGPVDSQTGFVMDFKDLKKLIHTEVIERFDHKNLNLDSDYFKSQNPTAENLVRLIYQLLRSHLNEQYDLFIRLWETERDSVSYPPASL